MGPMVKLLASCSPPNLEDGCVKFSLATPLTGLFSLVEPAGIGLGMVRVPKLLNRDKTLTLRQVFI